MKVLIPSALRSYTREPQVEAVGRTLDELFADLDHRYPGLRFRVVDEQDLLRRQHAHLRQWPRGARASACSAARRLRGHRFGAQRGLRLTDVAVRVEQCRRFRRWECLPSRSPREQAWKWRVVAGSFCPPAESSCESPAREERQRGGEPRQICTRVPSSTTAPSGSLKKSAALPALRLIIAKRRSRQRAMPLSDFCTTDSRLRK